MTSIFFSEKYKDIMVADIKKYSLDSEESEKK